MSHQVDFHSSHSSCKLLLNVLPFSLYRSAQPEARYRMYILKILTHFVEVHNNDASVASQFIVSLTIFGSAHIFAV